MSICFGRELFSTPIIFEFVIAPEVLYARLWTGLMLFPVQCQCHFNPSICFPKELGLRFAHIVSADDILIFFSYFSKKIGFDILCKLSPKKGNLHEMSKPIIWINIR